MERQKHPPMLALGRHSPPPLPITLQMRLLAQALEQLQPPSQQCKLPCTGRARRQPRRVLSLARWRATRLQQPLQLVPVLLLSSFLIPALPARQVENSSCFSSLFQGRMSSSGMRGWGWVRARALLVHILHHPPCETRHIMQFCCCRTCWGFVFKCNKRVSSPSLPKSPPIVWFRE